jgi:hypothetical protein
MMTTTSWSIEVGLADGEACIGSTMARSFHDATSPVLIASTTSGTDTTSQSSPLLSASPVAGGGCQRDGVGTGYGFAIRIDRGFEELAAYPKDHSIGIDNRKGRDVAGPSILLPPR